MVMAKFSLTIAIGNDAMLTSNDIAEALNRTADKLWGDECSALTVAGESGKVYDLNGQPVGEWKVSK